jgi:hypothetical protein
LAQLVDPDGTVASAVERGRLVLPPTAQANLAFISEHSGNSTPPASRISAPTQAAASRAVLDVLLLNGVGVRSPAGLCT